MSASPYVTRVCPGCGPRLSKSDSPAAEANRRPEFIVCPTCGMDPAEYAYRGRILADSDAVYAEEHRAFQAQRAAEQSRVA